MLSALAVPDVVETVNSTALPPGRICGHMCWNSPRCKSVTGVGGPPAEGIRDKTPLVLSAAMMLPSSPQLPPRPAGALHKVIAEPPSTEIFCSFPVVKKAIHCPSGEKNGSYAPCALQAQWRWADRAAV